MHQFVAQIKRDLEKRAALSGIDKTILALHDLMVREQFLSKCDRGLEIFLRERAPRDVAHRYGVGLTNIESSCDHSSKSDAGGQTWRSTIYL